MYIAEMMENTLRILANVVLVVTFSRLIWDKDHENVIDHVCNKLKLQGIGDYDSCKYFRNDEEAALLGKFVELTRESDKSPKTCQPVKKKSFLKRLFKGD